MKPNAYKWVLVAAVVARFAMPMAAEGGVILGGRTAGEPVLAVVSAGELVVSVRLPVSLNASDLTVDLWQLTGGLALPLEKGRSLAEGAIAPDAHGVSTVSIPFPAVKRKTQVLVKFSATQAPSKEIGRARVWVYPPANWEPIARRFKDEDPLLVVFGESEELRAFLQRRGVVFSDQGDRPPEKGEAGVLAVGRLSAQAWNEFKPRFTAQGGRLIVFVEDAAGLPGVYTTVNEAGAITRVTLPVLAGLADDPRAEDVFLQIIEQQLLAAPAAKF